MKAKNADGDTGLGADRGAISSISKCNTWKKRKEMIFQVVMKKKYKQIINQERDWIGRMKAQGKSVREMACVLKRSPSSISREIRRNQGILFGKRDYFPTVADQLATKRFSETHTRKRLKGEQIVQYVKEKLQKRWSPELIAGRLPMDFPRATISHEAIYQWIYAEAKEYIPFLARQRRVRKSKHYSRRPQKHYIPSRVGIEERPKYIEDRQEVGHWEVDTVGAKDYEATLQVITERKTRYTKVRKITKKRSHNMRAGMVKAFWNTPRRLIKTFTYDNGQENCGHLYVNYRLGSRSYFCHPYHSWERGSVENMIGLIRRIYPKKTSFEKVTSSQIETLQGWLNQRPKKCLGFKTPAEVFQEESKCCT